MPKETLNVANCRKSMTYGNLTEKADQSLQVLISPFLKRISACKTGRTKKCEKESSQSGSFFPTYF